MPISTCHCCGGDCQWHWEEAFEKFGFNDGDGNVETENVVEVLSSAGYEVESRQWGLHNVIIVSLIDREGRQLLPIDHPTLVLGYDDPRTYLPQAVIDLLDRELPATERAVA